jgi:hypothetical protein
VGVQGSDSAGRNSSSSSTITADVCCELLWSILCILDAAHAAAVIADGGASKQLSTAATPSAAAAAAGGGSVWCGQWMWGEVGACLMHHLSLVVPDSSSTAAAAVQLPVSTLDLYLKVSKREGCEHSRCVSTAQHDTAQRSDNDPAPLPWLLPHLRADQSTSCAVQPQHGTAMPPPSFATHQYLQ